MTGVQTKTFNMIILTLDVLLLRNKISNKFSVCKLKKSVKFSDKQVLLFTLMYYKNENKSQSVFK